MKRFVLAMGFTLASGMAVWAGPQYVDDTGFAVSGYDVVAWEICSEPVIGSSGQTLHRRHMRPA